jgi:hypothetical protein
MTHEADIAINRTEGMLLASAQRERQALMAQAAELLRQAEAISNDALGAVVQALLDRGAIAPVSQQRVEFVSLPLGPRPSAVRLRFIELAAKAEASEPAEELAPFENWILAEEPAQEAPPIPHTGLLGPSSQKAQHR